MDLNLKGKTALITGGSRGIGFGAARVLASEGVNVHLTSRTAADLEAAKKQITDAHKVNVTCHACDLGTREHDTLNASARIDGKPSGYDASRIGKCAGFRRTEEESHDEEHGQSGGHTRETGEDRPSDYDAS